MSAVWVIGAGGHAKVVIDALRTSGAGDPVGVLDDDPKRWGAKVMDIPILGDATLETIARHSVERAVVAVGSNRARGEIVRRLAGRVAWVRVVHPASVLGSGVRIGEGTVVFAGSVIQADTVVGSHAILNTSCSIDHDCTIGDFVHVGPGARVGGGVRLGEGVFLGIGSSVIPGRSVGTWSTVGAGAVVVRDLPGGILAKGVPARFPSESRFEA